MISMADEGSGMLPDNSEVGAVDGGFGDGDVTIDLELIYNILGESPDSNQSSPDEFAHAYPDAGIQKNSQSQNGFEMSPTPCEFSFEASDPSMVHRSYHPDSTDGLFMVQHESYVSPVTSCLISCDAKNEQSSAVTSYMYPLSESRMESSPIYKRRDRDEISQSVFRSCCTSSNYPEETSSHFVAHEPDVNILQDEARSQSGNEKVDHGIEYRDASCGPWMENSDQKVEINMETAEASLGFSGLPKMASCQIEKMPFTESDVSPPNVYSFNSIGFQSSNITGQLGAFNSNTVFDIAYGGYFVDSPQNCFPTDVVQHNDLINLNGRDCHSESASSVSEFSSLRHSEIKQLHGNYENGKFSFKRDGYSSEKDVFSYNQLGMNEERTSCLEDETSDDVVTYRNMMWQSEDVNNNFNRLHPCLEDLNAVTTGAKLDRTDSICFIDDVKMISNGSEHLLENNQPSYVSSKKLSCIKDIGEAAIAHHSRVSSESIQSNSSDSKSRGDDGSDICILEDISQPPPPKQSSASRQAIVPLQCSSFSASLQPTGTGILRRGNDERLMFQVALQDLSQPKSEVSLPDGVLAVPLLRHQRIALSWMVQKETLSYNCRGGILADDQGLGKTVSTIALILKERPQCLREDSKIMKKEELETVDLDDDDDEVIEVNEMKPGINKQNASSENSAKSTNSFVQSKGRPAAGTLVVCPTSVLRQWDEELHKKVTSEVNLSVLVYHGSNRTKDPCELAKYDVVLTTYSIVGMEVPKQNLADEDDNERRKQEGDFPFLGSLCGKKRKQPPGSGKKAIKSKKGMDGATLESIARPLAKVAWFRVVLDEAQTIKNHRTQVARACWGLRAKRRWCLSGTPIQNAIDDLYSYFRFLRCEPYAAYKSFCSEIKAPIQRNPTKGYRKLQAVLKTVMLRRTKGTLIDGEPIITLPPKIVELKKVEFTDEERDFYTRLEADSRAQFKEYAVAGTVKQNYVNILLMLLRLRQACDHPLLVRGWDFNSLGKSSIEMAKKLPREKQQCLLNCLEASLCGICNDTPEGAVVSVCGHVFCHQCINEHLSDDSQCPTTGCRVRLNASSVFSGATLSSNLLYHPGQDSSSSKSVEAVNSHTNCQPYGSSKIRAALEVLQSLTKSHDCTEMESSLKSPPDVIATSHEKSSSANNRDKLDFSMKNSSNAVKMGEKAIVFSQWTGMLDLLEASLKTSSIQYRRLDGTMSVVARDKAVKDFNSLPEVSVMLMSLKAASLGLNMVAACHVMLLDLWWNPTTEDQAIDRAHRIGQTRQVNVLRLTVTNTVEDRILALQQKKREMVASAFGEDKSGARQTRLTVEDLNYLFMA